MRLGDGIEPIGLDNPFYLDATASESSIYGCLAYRRGLDQGDLDIRPTLRQYFCRRQEDR
jgi:hypothetical protein